MPTRLADDRLRADLLNRLKRAEGQLRGIQRMVEAGDARDAVAGQLAAVRKALDSAYLRLTLGVLEQELGARVDSADRARQLAELMDEMKGLMAKLR